ncbi:MAG: recombinase family protein [Neisseria sp.]|uniref:recombinase family protein n=1 Tax=Neisseria sp. TaxID=192066 RepID=UPI0026DB0D3B|nr:recombinase family protein [Neisseria sp.]MDO4248218.1 recombinase family protein [Neisseria sp.]
MSPAFPALTIEASHESSENLPTCQYRRKNLERQNALVEKAKAEGYLLIAGVYKEKASGTRADRPLLNQLISDLQQGDVIVAEYIDRITRLPLPRAEKLVRRIKEKVLF